MWMIQKIGVGADGNIDRVQWQVANTTHDSWIGKSEVVPVIKVVDEVLIGRVGSAIPIGNDRSVQGPYVRTLALGGGVEGIEADSSDGETRSLFDLPRL